MMRVAICDDEIYDLEVIKKHTEELLNSLNLEYEILEFTNGMDLIEEKISFDLILLDIEMDDINGVEIARNIRTFNNDTKIIFISNSSDYLKIGYTVNAARYLFKPIDKSEFNYEISNVLKEQINDSQFLLDKSISPYKIYFKDILYIEYYDRKTIIHKTNEDIPTLLSLKKWLEILKKYNFSQSHRAYIINLRHIKRLETDNIIMINEEKLPLSRKYKMTFKSEYLMSLGEKV